MEQNKNQGRQHDQSTQQGKQQDDRNENLREEERNRSGRQGLTETDEDADAITSEGKQELGKQKPQREWDAAEEGDESQSGQRFPKPDQQNNKPNPDSGREGNQQR